MTNASSAPLLLVESDSLSRLELSAILRRRHLVTEVESGAAAQRFLALGAMPCMILCVLRDDDDSSSFRLAHQTDPTWRTVPIAMFSVRPGGPSEGFMDALLILAGRHCEVLQ